MLWHCREGAPEQGKLVGEGGGKAEHGRDKIGLGVDLGVERLWEGMELAAMVCARSFPLCGQPPTPIRPWISTSKRRPIADLNPLSPPKSPDPPVEYSLPISGTVAIVLGFC